MNSVIRRRRSDALTIELQLRIPGEQGRSNQSTDTQTVLAFILLS